MISSAAAEFPLQLKAGRRFHKFDRKPLKCRANRPIESKMQKILVVDDDEQLLRLQQAFFSQSGYLVTCAGNGKAAMKALASERFDLCVMDIVMPEQEGLETIQLVRQRYPDLKILAVSGGGSLNSSDYLKLAGLLGADHCLAKPFGMQVLKAAVDRLLGQA